MNTSVATNTNITQTENVVRISDRDLDEYTLLISGRQSKDKKFADGLKSELQEINKTEPQRVVDAFKRRIKDMGERFQKSSKDEKTSYDAMTKGGKSAEILQAFSEIHKDAKEKRGLYKLNIDILCSFAKDLGHDLTDYCNKSLGITDGGIKK